MCVSSLCCLQASFKAFNSIKIQFLHCRVRVCCLCFSYLHFKTFTSLFSKEHCVNLAKTWLQFQFLILNLWQVVLKLIINVAKEETGFFLLFFKGMTLRLLSWLCQESESNFSLVDMASFSKGQVVSEVSILHFVPWEGWGCVPDLILTVLYIHMHTINLLFFIWVFHTT